MVFQRKNTLPQPPLPPAPVVQTSAKTIENQPLNANSPSSQSPAPPSAEPVLLPIEQLPKLLVLNHAKVPGFGVIDPDGSLRAKTGSISHVAQALNTVDAMTQEFATDAHVAMYGIMDPRAVPAGTSPLVAPYTALSDQLLRLTKASLVLFEQMSTSGLYDPADPLAQITNQHVVGVALILDVDNPSHLKWTAASLDQAQSRFDEYGKRNPLFARPSFWYTTSGGSRYGYILKRPLMVEGAGGLEDRLGGLVALAAIAGLEADRKCKDWTRLMRLPCVRREEKPRPEQRTVVQSYFRFSWGKVDVSSREIKRPESVLAYDPDAIRSLSAITVEEMQVTAEARALANTHWRGRVGQAPATSRQYIAGVSIGEQPSAADVTNALLAPGGKISQAAQRARTIIEGLAQPRAKSRRPSAAAVYVFGILYEKRSIFTDPDKLDGFHDGILKLTRCLCESLSNHLGDTQDKITIELVFALAVDSAREANKKRIDAGRTDARSDEHILKEVWDALAPEYQRQIAFLDGQQRERAEAELVAREQAHEALRSGNEIEDAMKKKIREWLVASIPDEQANDQAQASTPEEKRPRSLIDQFVDDNWHKLLLLAVPNGTCVLSLNPMGKIQYSTPYKGEDVYAGIRDSGHQLINPYKPAKDLDDPQTILPLPHLKMNYCTVARYALNRMIPSSLLRGCKNIHTGEVGLTVVGRAMGMRQDLAPKYDPQVDEWLHLLAGADYIDKLLDWLAAFTRIDMPCAGLFIQGQKDIGKGMLGNALRNLTEAGKAVDFSKAVHEFQDDMIDTPFLWADENIESGNFTKSVMNTYKKIITGEYNSLNPKGEKPVTIEGHWRVLLTANTDKILRMDDASNNADLAAVVQRLVYVKSPNNDAARFIQGMGGREGAHDMVARRIPAHVLHLAAARPVAWGSRLLVEGVESDYHKTIANTSPTTDITIRSIGRMLFDLNKYAGGVRLVHDQKHDETRLYVLAPVLREMMVAMHASDPSTRISQVGAIVEALSIIADPDTSKHYRTRFGGPKSNQVRCTRIDVAALLDKLLIMGENIDYRKIFDAVHLQAWAKLAPASVRKEIEEADADSAPIPFVSPVSSAQPVPPPPPPAPPVPRGMGPNSPIASRSRTGVFSTY